VHPFVRSLRASGFAGECLLVTRGCPPGTEAALAAAGATPVAADLGGAPLVTSYNVARYRAFAGLLAARPDAGRVVLADVRDVVFQRDPFAAAPAAGLHLFLEHPARSIGQCIWTSSWIRYRYGDAALPPLADRPIACSGVVLGDAAAVRAYLGRVLIELTPPLRANNYMAGYDQGVVNVLAHRAELPGLVLHPYASAAVLHLGNAPPGAVRRDAAGAIVNDAGAVAAVVHQHDRHPELAGLAARWGG
jgi:hypothetical protein